MQKCKTFFPRGRSPDTPPDPGNPVTRPKPSAITPRENHVRPRPTPDENREHLTTHPGGICILRSFLVS